MQTPNVLIVEDEVVTRTTLKSLFEAEGYNVFEAENGDQMHDFFENHAINLVIMDINLPGKNGLILAREVRDRKNVGLIFLTGRDNDVDRILGLCLNMPSLFLIRSCSSIIMQCSASAKLPSRRVLFLRNEQSNIYIAC